MQKDSIEELRRKVYLMDFIEVPVDIETFICNYNYLGKITNSGESIYPFWKQKLKEIFSDKKIIEIILTGCIGSGKTSISAIIMAYILYLVSIMKNPWLYLGMLKNNPIVFLFFNISMDLAESTGALLLEEYLKESPWFNKRFGISRGKINLPKWLKIKFASSYQRSFLGGSGSSDIASGILGQNIIAGCFPYDTKVKTLIGDIEIGKLFGKETLFIGYEPVVDLTEWRLGEVIKTGVKDVYEVEFEDGTIERMTLDQKVFTRKGLKPLSDINIGDEIAFKEI